MNRLGVAAAGVSPDSPEKLKSFDEKYRLEFPLLSDGDRQVARAYGVWGEKNLYGKKSEGIIRSSFLIDEAGKLRGVWYKVSPKDTIPRALEVLQGKS